MTHRPFVIQARELASTYSTHAGLPPLAGLGSFADAVQPGLSVEESVRRHKHHHYALRRLHQLFIARITSEPLYELKMAWSHQGWLCAEYVAALRARVGEMREPPLGLEKVPHPALELIFDELLAAPLPELLLGLYETTLPAVREALQRHFTETHLLADQPTRRLLRFALIEFDEILDYGRKTIAALVTPENRATANQFLETLRSALASVGGTDGTSPNGTTVPPRLFSGEPWRYNGVPQRDARFPDPFNMGVNAEVFLYDSLQPTNAKVLMMYFKRLREIDVPEMMSSIITETPGKPWGYYRDMTRQLWDEARHAMMGEVGFAAAGVDWPSKVPINFTWSRGLNTQLTPKERHAVLYFIEQGLMPKTGKRHEWETAVLSENPLSATFQDFDWADEVLHARVGRDWYVSDMPSAHAAIAYGDACWSKVLIDWDSWRRDGSTAHANWWPAAYKQYCERNNVTPCPQVASYDTTYQSIRADLKDISASG